MMQPSNALRYDVAVIPVDVNSLPIHRLAGVRAESSLRIDPLLNAPKTGQGGLNLFRSGKPSTAIVNG